MHDPSVVGALLLRAARSKAQVALLRKPGCCIWCKETKQETGCVARVNANSGGARLGLVVV